MGDPSQNVIVWNTANTNLLFGSEAALAEGASLCQNLGAPEDPNDSFYLAPPPLFQDLGAASGMNIPPFFRSPASTVDDAALPDLSHAGSEELERFAREGYERDLQGQVRELLRDFPACAVYSLAANFNRLPRFLQEVWVDFADDPQVGFRIDYVSSPGGRAVPRITFVRMTEHDGPVVRLETSRTSASGNDFLKFGGAPTFTAAGILATRTPTTLGSDPEPGGGRGPNGIMRSNPVLGTAVTVGAGVLIYVAIDRQVSSLDAPAGVRSLLATGETGLLYEGLGRFGLIERPEWGNVLRAAPHLALLQMGASHLFDAFGLRRGSMGNNLASFGVSTTAYVGLPRLAGRFPRLANLYRMSVGLPAEAGAGAAVFRGSSLISGGLRFANVVGTVFLIDWLGGSLGDFFVWAGDGFKSAAPDDRLWRAAIESFYSDYAQNVGGFAGWSARNLPAINKSAFGWARFFSGSFDRDFSDSVNGVIRRWVKGANDFAEAADNGFVLCALQSFERETNGELRFDPEAFQLHVGQLYAGESDVVAAAYRMQSLVGPTRWGSGIGKTSEITRLVSEGGSVLDSSRLRRHVEALFRSPDFTKKVPGMLENLLREEQNALEERLASLNLSEGQSDRPRRTSALNQTQRDFLYGNGQTSEAVTRRRRIEILSTLLRRARAGEDILGAH